MRGIFNIITMGYAQLVIGPAGSGKLTYCYNLQQHCESIGRSVHIVNLDPAAENFKYSVAIGKSNDFATTVSLNFGNNKGCIS